MAIPVHLQQFKAAGVYRVVFDKSTMVNNEPETLRLVVGYSEVGPFNYPVYVKDPQEFIQYFGNISKKLEKRGIFFHRMCLQMLTVSPIICLNLKKFSGETVGASTISTDFNPNYNPIDDVKINVEDIFDKTRFWEISAEQLNDLNSVEGITLNNYINISVTDTYNNSVSYFIRKASGSIVSQYNVTVNDWYSDKQDEKPEYLEDYGNLLISDFFAEIYVFKGKFKSSQVLASDTLKKYFVATSEIDDEATDPSSKNYKLKLRNNLRNGYGELVDTLAELYADPTSNAIGHWVGCLIPYFKDKRGNYQALDIAFNQDNDIHKMMMSFNVDLLEEYNAVPIDLSGKMRIPTSTSLDTDNVNGVNAPIFKNPLSLETIYQGVAKTNLLGNMEAPVISDRIRFYSSIDKKLRKIELPELGSGKSYITGSLYVSGVEKCSLDDAEANGVEVSNLSADDSVYKVVLRQIRPEDKDDEKNTVSIYCRIEQLDYVLDHVGVTNYKIDIDDPNAEAEDGREKYILWHNVKYSTNELAEWFFNDELAEAASETPSEPDEPTNPDDEPVSDDTEPDEPATDDETAPAAYNIEAWKKIIAGGTFWFWDGKTTAQAIVPSNFEPFYNGDDNFKGQEYYGPSKIVTSIRRIENRTVNPELIKYTDIDTNFVCSFTSVNILSISEATFAQTEKESLYGSSVSFIDTSNWIYENEFDIEGGKYHALVSRNQFDNSLQLVLKKGDCLIADDGAVDANHDRVLSDDDKDYFYDNVYVQGMGTKYNTDGTFAAYYILLSGAPIGFDESLSETGSENGWQYSSDLDGEQSMSDDNTGWEFNDADFEEDDNNYYIVRIDAPLNQEIGEMYPHYLEGYTYKNARPNGTDMWAKLQWQKQILSALSEYSGLRKGLLNKANIDYRYVIDTFESFPQSELKAELSLLCKEKESAFCIANLPAIRTFVKCPYISFTDDKNIFNSKYIVAGRNRKKPSNDVFSLPTENNGASFVGFYTPLKFTDGYVDTIVPAAGLVSNLFIQKYMSRQPYYIVAGPNYGHITATGLVGPDYKFSREELYDLEPFGFNCMIYRPSFGTFINANQTAKQTPLSALSRINVRELVIYLQDEIEKVLQSYQWEFNNQTTRNAILDKANQVCSLIKANGGIQTYLNIMDESNNTPEIIDNEMAVLSTHIEPGFGCGKMVHELTLYRTGQMSSYITEK